MTSIHRSTVCSIFVFVISANVAAEPIDELRELVQNRIRAQNSGAGYAVIISFAAEPDVSFSILSVDSGLLEDDAISLIKFPLRHQFDLTDHKMPCLADGHASSKLSAKS